MPHFRTKARAVELLGKGQIADLPTAITELWKNGYDAYGDNLEAHLYFSGYKDVESPFFVLSDDGKGMSEKDILDKWIVLGTDSKARRILPKKGPETLGKEPRLPTGEKGIGRLSVAYLGSQMLMLTKKIGQPLQALFFDWRVLDNYNLFVEDIELPLKAVGDISDFNSCFSELLSDFRKNIPSKDDEESFEKWEEQEDLLDEISTDLDEISLPDFFEDEIIKPIAGEGQEFHGTKFIIFNPIDQLLVLKNFDNPDESDKETVDFVFSCLSGLSNVFEKKTTPFNSRFYIYDDEVPIELISQREFFDPEDFKNCDHLIDGKFDSEGLFQGTIQIYNQEIEHKFRATRSPGETPYGPFEIKFGYVEAVKKSSSLDDDQYKRIKDKLDLYSGLYIYRDRFRVLPYGRPDYDFLKMEELRSKGLSYYYFSYRNMFGYIEISRETNSSLKDKAGREGFINNKAYQEFKSDLQAFFYDLARKYFGKDAKEDYRETQKDAIEQEKQEHEREKQERKEFSKKLAQLPKDLRKAEGKLASLNKKLSEKVDQASVVYEEIESILREIDECKIKIGELKPPVPVRFKPTDHQRIKLREYEKYFQEVNSTVLNDTDKVISAAQERLKEKELLEEFKKKVKQYENSLADSISGYEKQFNKSVSELKNEIENEKNDELKQFKDEYSKLSLEPDTKVISKNLQLVESFFNEHKNTLRRKLEPLVKHLDKLSLRVNEDILVGYYKMEYERLKEQLEETQELAQLGIAIEIIDHQFNATYSRLANIISGLKDHIKEQENSKELYGQLKNLFEHLENNYKLITPLYRTTGRVRKDISGKDIREYIAAFYHNDIEEKEIKITSTKEFEEASYFTYESILKPVFINIINNAIYWLSSVENKRIHFDFKENKMFVMNSGEPIEDVYVEDGDIFNLFFTRKRKGRGIGLYLAKTTLNSIGFDIAATNDPEYNKLEGACFYIFKKED